MADSKQDHANTQHEEEKIHGDNLESAVSSNRQTERERNRAIPAPEDGGHPLSPAAHLGHAHAHDKPAGDQRALIEAEEFPRQPPREVSRAGKQHRRQ